MYWAQPDPQREFLISKFEDQVLMVVRSGGEHLSIVVSYKLVAKLLTRWRELSSLVAAINCAPEHLSAIVTFKPPCVELPIEQVLLCLLVLGGVEDAWPPTCCSPNQLLSFCEWVGDFSILSQLLGPDTTYQGLVPWFLAETMNRYDWEDPTLGAIIDDFADNHWLSEEDREDMWGVLLMHYDPLHRWTAKHLRRCFRELDIPTLPFHH